MIWVVGLVAGLLSIIQQSGTTEPRFSVLVFCILIAIITAISGLAFVVFRFTKIGHREKIIIPEEQPTANDPEMLANDTIAEGAQESKSTKKQVWTWKDTFRLCITQFFLSVSENGILISITPYVLKPYTSGQVLYQLAVNLSLILKPIFALIANVVPLYNSIIFNLAVAVCTLLQFIIAFFSPNNPAKDSLAMGIFLVIVHLIGNCLIAYSETKEFMLAQRKMQNSEKPPVSEKGKQKRSLLNMSPFRKAGLCIQLGGFTASLVMWFIIYFGAMKE